MNIQEDFGDGFVSFADCPTNEDEIHNLLRVHRAIQMPCGNIILRPSDGGFVAMIDDSRAEKQLIDETSVHDDVAVIYPFQQATSEENRSLMVFVKKFILDESAKVAVASRN
jgi:hypothetical protein